MFEDEKLEIIQAETGKDLSVFYENWVKSTKPSAITGKYFSYADGVFNLAIFYVL